MQDQDTEVTLGTGRLLALFFGLVVICALFFSAGFSLGRKSAPVPLANAMQPAALPETASSEKPIAARAAAAKPDCATPDNCPAAPSTSDEMTFYKAVEEKDAKPQLEQPAANPPAVAANAAVAAKQPEMAQPASLGTGYMVQIAAVSKQEDADALVNALRKKQYPVFAATLPTDKLYHVQVGPFADIRDADAMKTKLVSDGYNPIVKK
jgi:DedD protein